MQASLQQLRELMGTHLPRLAAHLEASGVDVSLFATQWCMPNPNLNPSPSPRPRARARRPTPTPHPDTRPRRPIPKPNP